MHKLDETDIRILRAMQKDGNLTVTEISERVGLSQSPCSRRIANLSDHGFILRKSVELDRQKLGFTTMVEARIKLKEHDQATLEAFKKAVQAIPEIQSAFLLLGEFDFRLRVVVRDIEHYQALTQQKLVNLPGVQEMQSTVVLEVVKNTTALPI